MTVRAPADELSRESVRPESRVTIDVARLLRVLTLLAGEGAGIAVFIHGFRARWLRAFVAQNQMPPAERDVLLQWIFAGAFLPCAAALGFLAFSWKKRGGGALDDALARISLWARLFAPAVLLWAMPQMSTYRAWLGRDLTYLISASLLVLAFEPALRVALYAGHELGLAEAWQRTFEAPSKLLRRALALVPHVAVAGASVAYIAYTSWYTILQHWRRQTGGLDLGYFSSFFWNTIHGRPFYCPITHPRDGSYLSIHAELAVYLLAPFYALWPRPETLLVIQSAMLGLAAIPLYLFARRRLESDWLAGTVALCFLLYVPLQSPNFTDFHFLTISLFFVLWAAYFFDSERKLLFWIAVAAALSCREDVPFGGIGVGLALLFSGRHTRTGAILASVSAAYLVIVKFVVMPRFGAPSFVYIYENLVASGEVGFAGVVKTLMTNPLYTLSAILLPQKLPYLLHVFMPLAFLPLRNKRYWFLLFPGFFVTLLSTGYMPVIEIRYQYVTHFTPYVFIGTVLVLEQIGKTRDSVARYAACGACVLGTYFAAHQFGALQHGNFYAGVGKVSFDFTDEHRQRLANLRSIAGTIPRDGTLAATEKDCAHLTDREYLFTLKYEAQGANYLLYSDDGISFGEARRIVREALSDKSFGFHSERPGFVVLRRGADTTRNDELLQRLSMRVQ
jgi:uncharacterized membrane protein